jgi:hypothetical protein
LENGLETNKEIAGLSIETRGNTSWETIKQPGYQTSWKMGWKTNKEIAGLSIETSGNTSWETINF